MTTNAELSNFKLFNPIRSEEHLTRNLKNLPAELMNESIWLVAADENGLAGGKIPHVITESGKLQRFSKNVGHVAMTFNAVQSFHLKYGYDIGILMTSDDHYTVIDLDAKELTNESIFNNRMKMFNEIIHTVGSYTEQSKSGVGYHIIVKSDILIARNFRQYGIEIYSYRERFMLCTGNKVSSTIDENGLISIVNKFDTNESNTQPIEYRDEYITELARSLGSDYQENGIELVEKEPTKSDDDVFEAILQSTFSESFMEITTFSVNTDFTNTKYPSGSEACMNVISILCRFTDSNSQVRRIFLGLDIAKRDKYTKNNYHVDRCLTIARGDQDLSIIDAFIVNTCAAYTETQSKIIDRRIKAESEQLITVEDREGDSVDLSEVYAQYDNDIGNFAEIPFPHGLIGDIARFIEAASPHKLRVASVGGALGIMSGIVGRQFRFNGSSLNHAIVIVANSTLGKEGATKGMNAVAKALAVSEGDGFFCFDKVSSGGALKTIMRTAPFGSVVTAFPEFAELLTQLKDGNNNAMSGLKGELLDVLTKNSEDSQYGGSKHAKKEDDREGMEAPSFSFIGDCTPNFYEGVTEEMNSSGFMSRLILLTHEGTTKELADRKAHLVKLPKQVVDELKLLVQQVISKYNSNTFIPVTESPEVTVASLELEQYLKLKYNTSNDESHRQIYGRTFLKVMTLASLFASCYNIGNPTISMEDFMWARALILRDVYITTRKLKSGEIGVSEETCKRRVSALFDKLLKYPKQRDKLAKVYNHVLDLGVLPRSLLSQRLQGNSFRIGQLSNTKTLEAVLDNMIKNGEVKLVTEDKKTILSNYTGRSIRGICYETCDSYFDKQLDVVADWLKEVGKEDFIKLL